MALRADMDSVDGIFGMHLMATLPVGEANVEKSAPMTGSEEFSEFLTKTRGVFALLGCKNEDKGIVYFHHHPKFDIDEDALTIGVEMYAQYACDFLGQIG